MVLAYLLTMLVLQVKPYQVCTQYSECGPTTERFMNVSCMAL